MDLSSYVRHHVQPICNQQKENTGPFGHSGFIHRQTKCSRVLPPALRFPQLACFSWLYEYREAPPSSIKRTVLIVIIKKFRCSKTGSKSNLISHRPGRLWFTFQAQSWSLDASSLLDTRARSQIPLVHLSLTVSWASFHTKVYFPIILFMTV